MACAIAWICSFHNGHASAAVRAGAIDSLVKHLHAHDAASAQLRQSAHDALCRLPLVGVLQRGSAAQRASAVDAFFYLALYEL